MLLPDRLVRKTDRNVQEDVNRRPEDRDCKREIEGKRIGYREILRKQDRNEIRESYELVFAAFVGKKRDRCSNRKRNENEDEHRKHRREKVDVRCRR